MKRLEDATMRNLASVAFAIARSERKSVEIRVDKIKTKWIIFETIFVL